jgi:deoxyribose-phosphate aldolase
MDLSPIIEHTALKADTTLEDIKNLCREAQQHGLGGICIPPHFVKDAHRMLGEERRIRIVTVVGFPMGYTSLAAKSEEIRRALEQGADDIDAVINIAAVKSGSWEYVNQEIAGIALATHMRGKTLKLILECGLLTNDEIRQICAKALEHKVKWLETSTGFLGHNTSPDMVKNLKALAGPNFKIKASGGIKTAAEAKAMVDAGADRIGTSAGLEILNKAK